MIDGRQVRPPLPVGHRVHRLLGSSNGQVLALARDNGNPVFLRIGLQDGGVENLGFNSSVFAAFQRAPQKPVSVIDTGWELVLVDAEGQTLHQLRVARDDMTWGMDDLLPVWRPNHFEIAFLGKVGVD